MQVGQHLGLGQRPANAGPRLEAAVRQPRALPRVGRQRRPRLRALLRFGIGQSRLPSRGEVETLRARVDELTARIEALEGRKEEPSA